jgi:NAD(P)-dependent dehydrogenase (short-subunit alcohol dehydrogenase family)
LLVDPNGKRSDSQPTRQTGSRDRSQQWYRVSVGLGFNNERSPGWSPLPEHAEPGQCQIFQADFDDSAAVNRLWEEYIGWSRGIDVLVNNAGATATLLPIDQLGDSAWDGVFQVNVKAPFF